MRLGERECIRSWRKSKRGWVCWENRSCRHEEELLRLWRERQALEGHAAGNAGTGETGQSVLHGGIDERGWGESIGRQVGGTAVASCIVGAAGYDALLEQCVHGEAERLGLVHAEGRG